MAISTGILTRSLIEIRKNCQVLEQPSGVGCLTTGLAVSTQHATVVDRRADRQMDRHDLTAYTAEQSCKNYDGNLNNSNGRHDTSH